MTDIKLIFTFSFFTLTTIMNNLVIFLFVLFFQSTLIYSYTISDRRHREFKKARLLAKKEECKPRHCSEEYTFKNRDKSYGSWFSEWYQKAIIGSNIEWIANLF